MPYPRFEGKVLFDEFVKVFGHEPTPEEVMLLIKFGKFVRLRAKNNTALKNYVQRSFTNLKVTTETRVGQNGKTYEAIVLTAKDKPPVAETEDE